jgi:tetratricopeptide (TPR) repeat protein
MPTQQITINMYVAKLKKVFLQSLFIGLFHFAVAAQPGNTAGGFVFGEDRRPIPDANVELLDEFGRSLGRTRTSSSGRYSFGQLTSGRFRIKVFSVGDYLDQEQDFEIQNIRTVDNSGNVRVSGNENVQKDFYLKPRQRSARTASNRVVFAQSVPADAREKFKAGLRALESNNEKQGLLDIKTSIEMYPDYYEAIERLGLEYIRLKHFVAAEALFLKAVQVNPRAYKSWYGLAYAFYSLDMVKDALESVGRALDLARSSVESLVLSGVLLRRQRQFTEAEERLRRANELSNYAIPQIRWQLAMLYANDLRRYKDAVTELEAFLKLSPNNPTKDSVRQLIDQLKEKAREN